MIMSSWKSSLLDFLDARVADFKSVNKVDLIPIKNKGAGGSRNELIIRICTTAIGSIITIGLSIYAIHKISEMLDPTRKEMKEDQKRATLLMKSIGISDVKLTEHELCMAANLLDTAKIDTEWSDIGGLSNVIKDLRETIIEPFQHPNLFSSPLSQSPKGILLYGPPGCGKTMVAKATAKAAGARFLNIQISSLFDKWYGESQKRAEAIFSLAKKIQPTIIFIDEIDSFLRERASTDHEATAMMKTQFMSLWDGLTSPSALNGPTFNGSKDAVQQDQVVVMAATNRPQDVDPAILRRMPTMFHIGLPDMKQRMEILKVTLKNEKLGEGMEWGGVLKATEGWSGSDLKELCRRVVLTKVQEALKKGSEVVGALERGDFEAAIKHMEPFKLISTNSFRSFE